ncbi:hypothetical protein LCGC14_1858740 [marine sediment metagenome]|uniref:Sulfotransferase domain-containing protein n=1 Tax=marine sediment metagenome TaxID=412755 RepID=A0A0F9J777_9ZZZZ
MNFDTEVEVDERKIWWIASYPKSGSTWVRMFMNAYMTGFPLSLNSGFQYAWGDNHVGFFQTCYSRRADQLTITEQIMIRPAALITMLNLSACKHVCLKTHHAKAQIDDMPLIPPSISGGAVYIIRDPRDIAISFADHSGTTISKTIENMNNKQHTTLHPVTKLQHILTSWSIHVQSWTSKNKNVPVKIIRYEDMLVNPKYEFEQILNGLGIKTIDRDKFNFALKETEFENLQALETKEGFREISKGERFFRVGKAGQWKKGLTPQELDCIQKNHGEVMREYGYDPVTSTQLEESKTPMLV